MLEIRNVTKIYRSKAGNEVKALDNVSITFPETGMVFILGKSGSGKSTLLNVIGGLDGCDGGEFVIKGKSSKDFAGSDFDAYRNTFIGFIFQEYNILDDFTVGANIGLALELQGKKATNEKITEILTEVELTDYAKRKPNELSGGQKQRIAIARALVKDPEIIMADEPTGALDSNTGKQIFDTLKELSKRKLVIIVSHDRDFAERYADRIIEMKDGQIESDVTKHDVEAKAISTGILRMNDNLLKIEKGYQLTPEDVKLINEYLRTREADILVSGDKRLNENVRSVAGISADNKSSVFDTTDTAKDVKVKQYDGKQTKFIRSSLPMKNAVKMGSSSLGHKKFRLVFTIFLSLIAFALFGFADTLGAYDKITAGTTSMVDTNIKNASFTLGVKYWSYSEGELYNTGYTSSMFNADDISMLNQKLGLTFTPVFNGSQDVDRTISMTSHMIDSNFDENSAYSGDLYGFASVTQDQLNTLGYTVTGTLPSKTGEIAISKFMYEQLNYTGFKSNAGEDNVSINAGQLTYSTSPDDANSIIGQTIQLNVGYTQKTFKITAVIDTLFEYDRYSAYIPSASDNNNQGQTPSDDDEGNALVDMIMLAEMETTLHYGFHCLGYVIESDITEMSNNMEKWGNDSSAIGESLNMNVNLKNDNLTYSDGSPYSMYINRLGTSADIPALGDITWIDGTPRTTLGENEMLIDANFLNQLIQNNRYNLYSKLYDEVMKLGIEYDPDMHGDIMNAVRNYSQQKFDSDMTTLLTTQTPVYTKACELYLAERGHAYNPAIHDVWELRNIVEMNRDEFAAAGLTVPTQESILGGYMKSIIKALYGINTDSDEYANVPLSVYASFTDRMWINESEDGEKVLECTLYSIREILTRLYAANVLYAPNSTVYLDDSFINTVIVTYQGKNGDYLSDEYTEEYRLSIALNAYSDFLNREYTEYSYGDVGYTFFANKATEIFLSVSGTSLAQILDGTYLSSTSWENGSERETTYRDYKVVGVFTNPSNSNNMWGGSNSLIICDSFAQVYNEYKQNSWYQVTAKHEPGIYAFAITPMPTDTDMIRKMIELSYNEDEDLQFTLKNQVMDTLSTFNDFIEVGATVFVWVGLGFALFAALMMMNFISTSISYKRREIGILRAVGARSSDVFKIFFSEALIIALINYVLSIAATIAAVTVLNTLVRNQGVNVTLLNFGIRQVALMLLVSVFVALLSSFLPVWNIARRKPVDAIKNK